MNLVNKNHNTALDGLRGIAALIVTLSHMEAFVGVVTSHTGQYSQSSTIWKIFYRLFQGGGPVAVFFVLSGYVLILGYKKSKNNIYFSKSSIKRYFRLTPMILVSTVFAFVLQSTIGFHNIEVEKLMGGHEWLATAYQTPLTIFGAIWSGLVGVYKGDFSYNGPLWTIQIELMGSFLLFSVSALFYERKNFIYYVIAISAFMIVLWGDSGIFYSLFFVGAALIKYGRAKLSPMWLIPAGFLASEYRFTNEAQYFSLKIPSELYIHFDVICQALAAMIIVAVLLNSVRMQHLLSISPIAFLGRISFALYALHLPIMMSVGAWVLERGYALGHPQLYAALAIFATISVAIVLATIAYRTVDRWSQVLANWIANRLIPNDKELVAKEADGAKI